MRPSCVRLAIMGGRSDFLHSGPKAPPLLPPGFLLLGASYWDLHRSAVPIGSRRPCSSVGWSRRHPGLAAPARPSSARSRFTSERRLLLTRLSISGHRRHGDGGRLLPLRGSEINIHSGEYGSGPGCACTGDGSGLLFLQGSVHTERLKG